MRIAYDNILNYASSLTATNEIPERPIKNILHPYLEKVFEAGGTPPTFQSLITATFNTPQASNCIVYGNHNILGSMQLTFKDALDALIVTFSVPVYPGNRFYKFNNLIGGIFKAQILVTSFINIEIGSIFLTQFLEMPRFNQGPDFSTSIRSTSFESGSGQSAGNSQVNLENHPFTWTDIDYSKINEFKEYLEFVQTSKPHWIDPYPELQEGNPQPDEKNQKFPIRYVKISEAQIPIPKRRIRDWKYNLNIAYREAR